MLDNLSAFSNALRNERGSIGCGFKNMSGAVPVQACGLKLRTRAYGSAPNGRGGKTLPFSGITTIRYFAIKSLQRTDYSPLIDRQGKTLEINYLCTRAIRDPARDQGATLRVRRFWKPSRRPRPDLAFVSGRSPLAAWLVVFCVLLPAAL